ncbi:hypothetical protein JCM5350_005906 [Sporobolomyces pararoseus]
MLTRRYATTLLRSSRSLRSIRFASSVSSADLPRAKPHEKIPFSAPPRDETKGDLGQVHLPSMVEKLEEVPMKIPSEPDAYQISSSPSSPSSSSEDPSSSSSSTPKLHTVSSPSTYPKEGRPTLAANSADDTFEGLPGDHKLPASAVGKLEEQTSSSSSKEEKGSESSSRGGEGEPLSQEDKVGLFKLGGILLGGWILSGLTRPYKPQHPEKKEIEI